MRGKNNIHCALQRIWNERLFREVEALRKSWRWRIGNFVLRCVEYFLGRKRIRSSLDLIEVLVRTERKFLQTLETPDRDISQFRLRSNSDQNDLLARVSDGNIVLALAVSSSSNADVKGDYFVAMELAAACKNEFGWKFKFVDRKTKVDLSDVDIIIYFNHNFIPEDNELPNGAFKIAWARNWFDLWAELGQLEKFDLILSSSTVATDYLRAIFNKPVHFFPIATNTDRFGKGVFNAVHRSDYCVVGSYWGQEKERGSLLNPEELPWTFGLYGKGWDRLKKFRKYYRGVADYEEVPSIYASTTLIIDDSHDATRLWGSVNSRVFDALASGKLVLTNDLLGAEEIFDNHVPTYTSKAELHKLIQYYLKNHSDREQLALQLHEEIEYKHTYKIRANKLKEILLQNWNDGVKKVD